MILTEKKETNKQIINNTHSLKELEKKLFLAKTLKLDK
jgi:hypothetical protein